MSDDFHRTSSGCTEGWMDCCIAVVYFARIFVFAIVVLIILICADRRYSRHSFNSQEAWSEFEHQTCRRLQKTEKKEAEDQCDHRRTRTCNLLVPSAIEAKRATIAPGSHIKMGAY